MASIKLIELECAIKFVKSFWILKWPSSPDRLNQFWIESASKSVRMNQLDMTKKRQQICCIDFNRLLSDLKSSPFELSSWNKLIQVNLTDLLALIAWTEFSFVQCTQAQSLLDDVDWWKCPQTYFWWLNQSLQEEFWRILAHRWKILAFVTHLCYSLSISALFNRLESCFSVAFSNVL